MILYPYRLLRSSCSFLETLLNPVDGLELLLLFNLIEKSSIS